MNQIQSLEDLLNIETGRRPMDLIADLIFQRPALFGELMSIFFRNEEPLSRRAAWVMEIVSDKHPELVEPYLEEIVVRLPGFTHDGMKRESTKILARSPMVKEQFGALMNICFGWLVSPVESVAVKVYCMEILYRMSEKEPALKHELADSIEWRMPEETPGYKSRGRKILAKLKNFP